MFNEENRGKGKNNDNLILPLHDILKLLLLVITDISMGTNN